MIRGVGTVLPGGAFLSVFVRLRGFQGTRRHEQRARAMTSEAITVLIVLVLLALIAIGIFLWRRNRRTEELKSRYGPEYDRAVDKSGNERKAETVLADRERRVASFHIEPISPQMRDHFIEIWQRVQAQFVDDPDYAVTRADDLLSEVMLARGYPVHDFEQRADDLSVDHPGVVQSYRTAHEIALRHSHGEASTEDLRTAMIHYRTLFDDLVNEPVDHAPPMRTTRERHASGDRRTR